LAYQLVPHDHREYDAIRAFELELVVAARDRRSIAAPGSAEPRTPAEPQPESSTFSRCYRFTRSSYSPIRCPRFVPRLAPSDCCLPKRKRWSARDAAPGARPASSFPEITVT
jgi:hypothetical protein